MIEKARSNFRRWMAGRGDDAFAVVYREWEDLLDILSPQELARLLVAADERAVRLRQSSPFAGALPPKEVGKSNGVLWQRCMRIEKRVLSFSNLRQFRGCRHRVTGRSQFPQRTVDVRHSWGE